jgi:hypothetical protein
LSYHNIIFSLVKISPPSAVYKAQITYRIYLESEQDFLAGPDHLLLEELQLLHRTCDVAVRITYIPMYCLQTVSITDIPDYKFGYKRVVLSDPVRRQGQWSILELRITQSVTELI